mmetsp:Transcript_27771/g.70115  ORF Transcript_27771/g.70115 Transcript_27771/m.70115 type:complete len:143 (+) Transcript_27771:514-942(+)|eukprot:CAMPEP_0178988230 /NCGR_PEP_ID=MMETSP0795-20121207/3700_1 /TAXON_ID=88552 /ORGANISM="Amoebophrya sp., Strain Ameob2" /LENGTH=142 /DNA_ID=CAMNT_0020679491 /DNA_START=448 /DNA_END=876 /DNA_ORIENTATION=-
MVLHDRTKHVKYENTPWFQRKERESGDVKSSVRAAAKKDGQGGAYTWTGGAADLELNFVSHSPVEQVAKVKSAEGYPSSTASASTDSLQSMEDFQFNEKDFPPLARVNIPNGMKGGGSRSTKVMKAADEWSTRVMMDQDLNI